MDATSTAERFGPFEQAMEGLQAAVGELTLADPVKTYWAYRVNPVSLTRYLGGVHDVQADAITQLHRLVGDGFAYVGDLTAPLRSAAVRQDLTAIAAEVNSLREQFWHEHRRLTAGTLDHQETRLRQLTLEVIIAQAELLATYHEQFAWRL